METIHKIFYFLYFEIILITLFDQSDGLSNKEESRTPDGAVHGSYSYLDPHGRLITNTYVADASGFRYLSLSA